MDRMLLLNKIEKIFSNKYIIVVLLLPYIKPATELTGDFDIVFDVFKILSALFSLCSYLAYMKKPSNILLGISLLQFSFLLSTIIVNGRIWWVMVQLLSIISLCALTELTIKINKNVAFTSFSIALTIMAVATIISMFVFYPTGMYTVNFEHDVEGLWHIPESSNYLWGFDNSSVFKFIVTITILLVNSIINKTKTNKLIAISVTALSTIAFIYVKSITAAMVCLFFLLYTVYMYIHKKGEVIFSFKNSLIIISLIFLLLMFFNNNIDILQNIAEKTDKVTSLNYRFIMWNKTINVVKDNWLFGYGFQDALVTAHQIGMDHPHNIILDIIYRGGIIALGIFGAILYMIYKETKTYNKSIVTNTIVIGIFCIFCLSQMDYYNEQYLMFILYILAFNVKYLIEKKLTI